MSVTNQLWGAPRIHSELLELGINVAQTTVAKYMAKRRRSPGGITIGEAIFHNETGTFAMAQGLDTGKELAKLPGRGIAILDFEPADFLWTTRLGTKLHRMQREHGGA
jgi:hypothetical protein